MPPRQTRALPESKRLVATTPNGPRKLWAKGMVKFPMLYPVRLMILNAFSSPFFPALIKNAMPVSMIPPPSPRRLMSSMDGFMSIPVKFVTMAAGSVILSTILDST